MQILDKVYLNRFYSRTQFHSKMLQDFTGAHTFAFFHLYSFKQHVRSLDYGFIPRL